MRYKIIRDNKSGGNVNIGLNKLGNPVYTSNNDDALEFVKNVDAYHYLKYCERTMQTVEGQTNFKIVILK